MHSRLTLSSFQVDEAVSCCAGAVSSLAFGLAFLQRMGMTPLVVLGLPSHSSLSDTLTFPETKALLAQNCRALMDSLHQNNAMAMPFFGAGSLLGVEQPGPHSRSAHGPQQASHSHVPAATWWLQLLTPLCCHSEIIVDTGLLRWCLEGGHIPLVCPIGETHDRRALRLDSAKVTTAITEALMPSKIIFLNTSGGLRDSSQKVCQGWHGAGWSLSPLQGCWTRCTVCGIPEVWVHFWHSWRQPAWGGLGGTQKGPSTWRCCPSPSLTLCAFPLALQVLGKVNLPADLGLVNGLKGLGHKQQQQIQLIAQLLSHLPPESSAVITSAHTLLAELFSYKGESIPQGPWHGSTA